MEYLNKKLIDGKFNEEELTPVHITKQTQFQIYKIIATRVRCGIKQHLAGGEVITLNSTVRFPRPTSRNFNAKSIASNFMSHS
jgi:hypothetical protein